MRVQLALQIFALFTLDALEAQEWFPLGATWYYNEHHFFPEEDSYAQFTVVDELEIQGKQCKLVEGYSLCVHPEFSGMLCQEGDIIYSYNAFRDTFLTLYDFTLQPGDTILLEAEGLTPTYYRLEYYDEVLINNIPVRTQYFSWLDGNGVFIGNIIYEYIGNTAFLFPQIGVCDPLSGPLRCYQDTIFGLIKFNGFKADCDTIISATSEVPSIEFTVTPNPASDFLEVSLDTRLWSLTLIDLITGWVVDRYLPDSDPFSIDLTQYTAGSYVLQATSGQRLVSRRVIIIR